MTERLDLRNIPPSEAQAIIEHTFKYRGVQNIMALVKDQEIAAGLARKIGDDYKVQVGEQSGDFYLNVHKTPYVKPQLGQEVSYVLLIGSLTMGQGNKSLGQKLLNNLLESMARVDLLPSHIVLLNEAVSMALQQAPQLAALEQLAALGCEIMISVDSLDFYANPAQLALGYAITSLHLAELMAQAGKVVAI